MRFRQLVSAMAIVAVSAACATAADSDAGSGSTAPNAPGRSAPESDDAVVAPTAAGGQFEFDTVSGQDVLLWFWAPW